MRKHSKEHQNFPQKHSESMLVNISLRSLKSASKRQKLWNELDSLSRKEDNREAFKMCLVLLLEKLSILIGR
jgi:hypothetical protein